MHTQDSTGLNRREILRLGAAAAGVSLLNQDAVVTAAAMPPRAKQCILLLLVGGPSQLETWDPKPDAPIEYRGPFQAISSSVPGIQFSETLPRLSRLAHHLAILRTVHHTAAPIHETGHQLLQTGQLDRGGLQYPHVGAVLSYLAGSSGEVPPFVVVPGPIENTGVSIGHGQGAGFLGAEHAPVFVHPQHGSGDRRRTNYPSPFHEPQAVQDRYGRHLFGQSCLFARQLVEQGTQLVTVNMFTRLFNETSWDCHAEPYCLPTTVTECGRTVCPLFDTACAALIEDLQERGLLETTLVAAMGEMGRTPQLNDRGGRDHWTGAWSMMLAGGGIEGGQIIGRTDTLAGEPVDRPITLAEVVATLYHWLGVNGRAQVPTTDGRLLPIVDASPIKELGCM